EHAVRRGSRIDEADREAALGAQAALVREPVQQPQVDAARWARIAARGPPPQRLEPRRVESACGAYDGARANRTVQATSFHPIVSPPASGTMRSAPNGSDSGIVQVSRRSVIRAVLRGSR